MPKYCEHFEYLKTSESISIDKEAACKHCFQTQQLWMCLAVPKLSYRNIATPMYVRKTSSSTYNRIWKVKIR